MTLGSKIREYRIARGYTQAQMADKLGMTEANFSSYERDKSTPPISKLIELSLILNVSIDYLLGKTNTPKNAEITSEDYADGYDIENNGLQKIIDAIEQLKTNQKGLTPEESNLIDRFRKLPSFSQQAVLNLISSLEEINKSQHEQAATSEAR